MSEGSEAAPRREVPTWLLPGLVVVLGGAALAGLLWWLAIPQPGPPSPMDWTPPVAARVEPGETERYMGTASCRECHKGGARGARADCVECHSYHPPGPLSGAPRHLTIEDFLRGHGPRPAPRLPASAASATRRP